MLTSRLDQQASFVQVILWEMVTGEQPSRKRGYRALRWTHNNLLITLTFSMQPLGISQHNSGAAQPLSCSLSLSPLKHLSSRLMFHVHAACATCVLPCQPRIHADADMLYDGKLMGCHMQGS